MRNALKDLERLKLKHKKDGRTKGPRVRANFPNLKTECSAQLSNTIVAGGHKRDLLTEHKWKKGSQESADTVKQIEEKAKRIRPHYSKGPHMYATDGDNSGPLTIHKKGG